MQFRLLLPLRKEFKSFFWNSVTAENACRAYAGHNIKVETL